MRRAARALATSVALATALSCTASDPGEDDAAEPVPRPRVMAALGDSITRGYAACGGPGDCVETSWATGSAEEVNSHWRRLGHSDDQGSHNVAVSGARVTGLASQVGAAVRVKPAYVTILIGANDACAPDEEAMTSVGEFTDAFDGALDTLVRELPEAHVLVLSMPDLARLWEVGRDRPEVRRVWEAYGICQSMLADPTDTSPAAQGRRERVRERVRAYNSAMAAACQRHAERCRHDRSAVFDHRFDLEDVSTVDYWHPSRRGQATLARVAWEAGYWP